MTRPTSKICLFALILLSFGFRNGVQEANPRDRDARGNDPTRPPSRSDNGWPPRFDVPAEKFCRCSASARVARQFDMNPATFEKAFKEGMKENPGLEALLPNVRQQVVGGDEVFGIDQSSIEDGASPRT